MRKSKVLSIRISEVTRQIKKMKNKDLFATYESFDNMITQIIQMFENNDFCRKYRAHQNFIYMVFLDLVKIYNVFYIMTMETLDRYKRMSSAEMNKALILYKNFCSFTDTLKKEANTIPMLFGFSFKEPNYYKPDPKKERAMKNALKDKEAGGDGFLDDDDDFAEEMPDFEDQEKGGFDEYKEEDEENSDDDYQFDILGDVKKQEQMASVSGGKISRKSTGMNKRDKIQIDDFNTAALDDLLGGEAPPPKRSETMVSSSKNEEEWDPFANKDSNVYNDSNQQHSTQQPRGSGGNIFGDDDNDMWSGNQPTSSEPISKQDQKQALEDILGGDDFGGSSGQTPADTTGGGSDFNMLKNLYNTATAPQNQTSMAGAQPGYYNTSMGAGAGGYTDNSMGYNNMGGGYGGGGYQQYNTGGMGGGYGGQQQYSTGYGGGYNDGSSGYNNYGGQQQYNTGYGGGGYGAGGGYATGGYQENPQYTGMGGGYGTSAPATQSNQDNNFDPFA